MLKSEQIKSLPMYLKSVRMEHIRSLPPLIMEFEQPIGWHVLLGDNGSGKTSLIQAITLMLVGAETQLLGLSLRDWVKQGEYSATVALDLQPFKEKGWQPTHKWTTSIKIHLQRPMLKWVGDLQEHRLKYAWFTAAFGNIRSFKTENETFRKFPQVVQAHYSMFKEDAPFMDTIRWLQKLRYQELENSGKDERKQEAKRLLAGLTKLINEGKLLPDGTVLESINSEGVFFRDAQNHLLDMTTLSSGFQTILSLIFEIIRHLHGIFGADRVFQYILEGQFEIPLPGVVLIDEIDAHLHPTWQIKIGAWLTRYFPKIQFIVTTHSPLICRSCERGNIWKINNNPKEARVELVLDIDKKRLIYGNILEAYATELFGQTPVRSAEADEKLKYLGRLNRLAAYGKISSEQELERRELLKIFSTDDALTK